MSSLLMNWLFPQRKPSAASRGRQAADTASHCTGSTRKETRKANRESLYRIVRDSMTRGEILKVGYKFKVLSLDAVGSRFMVMVDLSAPCTPEQMALVEALIVQSARSRFAITVTAVYWRHLEQALHKRAPGLPREKPAGATITPAASAPFSDGFIPIEPISVGELAAFNRALAETSQTGTKNTFMDTTADDGPRMPALSGTQYGDLE